MSNYAFSFGFLVGIMFIGILTFITPLYFTGVQINLVKEKHGIYNQYTGNFELKECK